MTLLALDLGTTTGFAYRPPSGVIVSGTWQFKSSANENELSRFARFRDQLDRLHERTPVKRIWYELVARHVGTRAAHVYGGFKGQLETWCHDHGVALEGVPVGVIKKFWTGFGNAPKDDDEMAKRNAKVREHNRNSKKKRKEYAGTSMVGEAEKRGFLPADDNEADALAILHYKILEG